MMHSLFTLDDGTEVVYSDIQQNGKVKVYFERPNNEFCFCHATCWLPQYEWEDINGFTADEICFFQTVLEKQTLK